MLSLSSTRRQGGFIQAAILFGIALLTAVIGGFALANRTPNTQTTLEQAKVNASVILKQGADLREGVTRFMNDKGSLSNLTFNTTTNTGLFDPSVQYASVQLGPAQAYVSGTPTNTTTFTVRAAGSYVYHDRVTLNGVGSAAADTVVLTGPLNTATCQRINTMLYGTAISTAPPTTTVALADFTNTATATAVDLSATTGIVGWSEGCVGTATVGSNVYFKVVNEG